MGPSWQDYVEEITVAQAMTEIAMLSGKANQVRIVFGGEGYLMLTYAIDLAKGKATMGEKVMHFIDEGKNAIGIPIDKVSRVVGDFDRLTSSMPEYHLSLIDAGGLVQSIILVFDKTE